jgi:hypothetical protein
MLGFKGVRFLPLIEKLPRKHKRQPGAIWRMDETCIEIQGARKYLYRAVDKEDRTVDLLSITCANVHNVLFLPRAVLLTVLVPDRRHFPASRRRQAGGSATRYRLARLG